MTLQDLGSIGEFVGSIVVMLTLIYLAVQVRQNTAQQKREETVSIQRGQNQVVSQLRDPAMVRAYVRAADGETPATVADRSRAIVWVVQYLNHFQIVHDLYRNRALDEETYQLWAGFAVAMVAPGRIRQWWEDRSHDHPRVRSQS